MLTTLGIGLRQITEIITNDATHVCEIDIPERIDDKEAFQNFRDALKNNKPKKGKKKKGKKKKN